jgi:hypothetical protein
LRRKDAFLKAFRACCNISAASAACSLDRANHYQWLRDDPKYAREFEDSLVEAAGTLEDSAVEWATRGVFTPNIWQGHFVRATRERTLCLLPDGREVFAEDLPVPIGDLRVQARRTITEEYGPPLGTYRRSEGLLSKLLSAHIERFRPAPPAADASENADAPAFVVTVQTREPRPE